MSLISLEQAKDHLRILQDADNTDLDLKVQQAEDLVLTRCNRTETMRTTVLTWTDATVPASVQGAIFAVVGRLYEGLALDAAFWAEIDLLLGPYVEPVFG